MTKKEFQLCGLGNAIVDIFLEMSDAEFAALGHLDLAVILKPQVWSVILVLLALRLWRHAGAEIAIASGPISVGQVFVTTLFNPKALIFAFVIFPRSGFQETVRYLALFSILVIGIGCAWIALGRAIGGSAGRLATQSLIARCAAVALGVFATVIAGSAVASAIS